MGGIQGPFSLANDQRKFIVVKVDYFTKWAEAEPLVTITNKKIIDLVWKFIMCKFGNCKMIIADNRKQFDNKKFRNFCKGLSINLSFSSVAHLQSNGQVELTNRIIM